MSLLKTQSQNKTRFCSDHSKLGKTFIRVCFSDYFSFFLFSTKNQVEKIIIGISRVKNHFEVFLVAILVTSKF